MNRSPVALLLGLFSATVISCSPSGVVRIGSKEFTESEILGEMATRLAKTEHANVIHLKALGGTRVLWDGLVKGEIDLYPEYTGTLTQEIFAGKRVDGNLADALST
jgi:osmoprotectant transport system permease protein